MGDKNGANYCAIKEVFAIDFITSKVDCFQMH